MTSEEKREIRHLMYLLDVDLATLDKLTDDPWGKDTLATAQTNTGKLRKVLEGVAGNLSYELPYPDLQKAEETELSYQLSTAA